MGTILDCGGKPELQFQRRLCFGLRWLRGPRKEGSRAGRKIGLLSPYNGGNLGDGAIHDALIHHIRRRIPNVELAGFMYSPQENERRHGIPSFDLSARPSVVPRMPGILGRIPVFAAAIRLILHWCDRVFAEVEHTVRSFRILKGFDMLVVAGGGQLDEEWGGAWKHPFALFKWSNLARLRGVRFVILSVGVCALDSQRAKTFIASALRNADYRSYRDERSRQIAQSLFAAGQHRLVPDLAFSLPIRTTAPERGASANLCVGISPIVYCDPRAWPKADADLYADYKRKMAHLIARLLQRGFSVTLFTSASADLHALQEIRLEVEPLLNVDTAPRLKQVNTNAVNAILQQIPLMDIVIASRLHGIILSHLNGKPVLAISHDAKVDIHMRDAGQEQFCLDIHRLDAEIMLERFDALHARAEDVRNEILRIRAQYRAALEKQYDDVFGVVPA
jgi:polysaccharide pyruvyl transferase WcaK-like protein